MGKSWFFPVKVEQNGKLLAVGEGILHGPSAWIGNVIVASDYRRQGLGMQITRHLRDELAEKGARSQLLLATEMGKRPYEKLGFKTESRHLFFRTPDAFPPKQTPVDESIREMSFSDLPEIVQLDFDITGERRDHLLRDFWKGGRVIRAGQENLSAFYLPELGEGLVLARVPEAGMRMLRYRLQHGPRILVVPEQQQPLITWLQSRGFRLYRVAYRMVYGERVLWDPKGVYSRIGGYLG